MTRGQYTPQLKPELITRLYHTAKKFDMLMTRLLNVIVGEGLDALHDLGADDIEFVETVGGSHPEQPPEEVTHANG